MMPSPKERFLANAASAKAHSDTVASAAFVQALDAAMLEYASVCASQANPSEGGLMLRGAKGFASVLCGLAMPLSRPKVSDRSNLD